MADSPQHVELLYNAESLSETVEGDIVSLFDDAGCRLALDLATTHVAQPLGQPAFARTQTQLTLIRPANLDWHSVTVLPSGRESEVAGMKRGSLGWLTRSGTSNETNEDDEFPGRRAICAGFEYMLHPASLLSSLLFEEIGRTVVADRVAVHLSAQPRSHSDFADALHELGWGNKYDLLVDASRGVVLTARTWLDGRLIKSDTFTRIVFDDYSHMNGTR